MRHALAQIQECARRVGFVNRIVLDEREPRSACTPAVIICAALSPVAPEIRWNLP